MLIDDVDRRIVALLNERTLVVEDIGRVKRGSGLPIYEPRREDQVMANITETTWDRSPNRRCAASSSASSTRCATYSASAWKPTENR